MPTHTSMLSAAQQSVLLQTLKQRFEQFMPRHPNLNWDDVQAKLINVPHKLGSLYEMEHSGGEPDVIGCDEDTGEYLFVDCAPESPAGRRSACYDRAAQHARKNAAPATNVADLCADMGISLLTETQYRALQTLGAFDTKTSSWIATPQAIRCLGGALFADRRYDHVFVYHNGAASYYSARGFRGLLRV